MVAIQTSARGIVSNKSKISANKNERPPLRRIAIKELPSYQWQITKYCPFRGKPDPLKLVRESVADGNMVMFTRKIAPFHFELWARARW